MSHLSNWQSCFQSSGVIELCAGYNGLDLKCVFLFFLSFRKKKINKKKINKKLACGDTLLGNPQGHVVL